MGIEAALIGAAVGGAFLDNKNAKAARNSMEDQRAQSQAYIERMSKQARQDIFKLFPAAQQARQKGYQASFDLYKKSVPVMADVFQQGNLEAQRMLAQGLPQIQNAILGAPVDTGFAPQRLRLPQGGMGLQMPAYAPIQQQAVQTAPPGLPDYAQFMRGY